MFFLKRVYLLALRASFGHLGFRGIFLIFIRLLTHAFVSFGYCFFGIFSSFSPMKLLESFATLRTRIMADKRILSGVVATTVAILSVGGYFGYQEFAKRWAVPMVSGANFSLEYRKIPFDAQSIDITFSTELDPTSITTKNVTLSPFVEGGATLKDKNTVSYALNKKLAIGETYTLTIGSDIKSIYGKELGAEQVIAFEAIAGAAATKILPSGKLENLRQNIIILDNIGQYCKRS